MTIPPPWPYPAGTGATGQRAGGADRLSHRRIGCPCLRDFHPGVSVDGAGENRRRTVTGAFPTILVTFKE
jgi:hypothetical protein